MTSNNTIKHCSLSSPLLSTPQLDVWFNQILPPDVPLYNIGGYVRIEGAIDPSLFEKALNQVIQENDALRLILHEGETLPAQTFAENVGIQLDFHNFSEQANAHESALKWMKQEFVKPFQFYGQFLFQFALFKISTDCYYSFQKYHHLIAEDRTIYLLVQQVVAAYNALAGVTGELQSHTDLDLNDVVYFDSEKLVKAKYDWQDDDVEPPSIREVAQFEGQTIANQPSTLCLKRPFYNQLIDEARDVAVEEKVAATTALVQNQQMSSGAKEALIKCDSIERVKGTGSPQSLARSLKKENAPPSSGLRVVSVNIEGNVHLDRVIPFLKKQNADIICLQEVFSENLRRFEQELGKKSYFCVNAKVTVPGRFRFEPLGEWGIAILTSLPTFNRFQIYYSYSRQSTCIRELIPGQNDSQCNALQIFTVVDGQKTFTIANTHFTWTYDGNPNLKQWRDLTEMLDILKDWKEIVLLGDFNAPRGRAVFSELSRHYQDNIPKEVSSTIDGSLHRAGDLNLVVDGLFTTAGYQASEVKLHHGVSDHCAITAEIKQRI